MYSHARTDSLKLEVILNQTFQVVRVLSDRVKPSLLLLQSGLPFKGIIWSQKRKKSVDFFVVKGILGQRYCESDYWQSLRVDFPKSKPSLYNQKKKGKLLSIG